MLERAEVEEKKKIIENIYNLYLRHVDDGMTAEQKLDMYTLNNKVKL